jgi:hypothetical protein
VRDERLLHGNHVEALESPARIVARVTSFIGEIESIALREAA